MIHDLHIMRVTDNYSYMITQAVVNMVPKIVSRFTGYHLTFMFNYPIL